MELAPLKRFSASAGYGDHNAGDSERASGRFASMEFNAN